VLTGPQTTTAPTFSNKKSIHLREEGAHPPGGKYQAKQDQHGTSFATPHRQRKACRLVKEGTCKNGNPSPTRATAAIKSRSKKGSNSAGSLTRRIETKKRRAYPLQGKKRRTVLPRRKGGFSPRDALFTSGNGGIGRRRGDKVGEGGGKGKWAGPGKK